MRPLARQKIYKKSPPLNLFDFITFEFFNLNQTNELNKYLNNFFNTQNLICLIEVE